LFLSIIAVMAAQNIAPQPATAPPPVTYAAIKSARVPITTADITDRPYRVLAHVHRNVRKTTLFSKGATQEKLENELWERGQKIGADAIVNARFGGERVVAMSWGANKVEGDAVKFLTDQEIAERAAAGAK
jgi:hypothetical protein